MSNLASLFDRYKALVIFDTETSGLNPGDDQIIELAALRVERTQAGALRIAGKMDTFIRLPEGERLPENIVGRYKNTRTKGGPYSQRSHWILMGTGNTKADGTSWIPFQRMSKTRTDIQKMTTISVPQMITSDRTNEAIMLRLNTETAKRLDHHMKRALGL